jgi:cyclic pyranopterin monophosphate synthase
MEFSHLDAEGRVKMVDVGGKEVTDRVAVAGGAVLMRPETVAAIRERRTPKGDPLEVARIAGILAAKRTDALIPLCHSLPLSHVDVEMTLETEAVRITATARTAARTGVEMEALTAATVAALTIYDMCKAIDKGMTISEVRLLSKTGGKNWTSETKEE